MKNSKLLLALVMGFLLGAMTFGNIAATSAAVNADRSPHKLVVDGGAQSVEAYNIGGANYYKLRDMARSVDFRVWFDDASDTVHVETGHGYDPDYTGPAKPAAEPAPAPAAAQPDKSADVTVYVTKTGDKYHVGSCSYLRQSKIATTLSDAKRDGYTPCSRCNPPS